MNSAVVDRLINAIDVEANLLPFLKYSGWGQVDDPNWIVLHGEHDADGYPLEMVFPREETEADRREYVVKAVELLTALKNEPMQLVLQSVINYDRDMLYVRNTDTLREEAIAFNLAVNQVNNLKSTIEYSACSEREAKPYFLTRPSIAKRALRDFLFGHTFAGSFGFTVEAPRLPDPPKFIQKRLELGEEYSPPPVDVPFNRRIMERIARGLIFARRAQNESDPDLLVREYTSGFNSNVCSAIVGISQEKQPTTEFRIAWSPKIKASDDIADIEPIKLRTSGYEMLEDAARILKSVKPEFVQLVGHVHSLTASDNPLSLGTRRAVVIRGFYTGSNRTIDVIVELDREDYAKASDAHLKWQTIQINGIIIRSGNSLRLVDAHEFRIIS